MTGSNIVYMLVVVIIVVFLLIFLSRLIGIAHIPFFLPDFVSGGELGWCEDCA